MTPEVAKDVEYQTPVFAFCGQMAEPVIYGAKKYESLSQVIYEGTSFPARDIGYTWAMTVYDPKTGRKSFDVRDVFFTKRKVLLRAIEHNQKELANAEKDLKRLEAELERIQKNYSAAEV